MLNDARDRFAEDRHVKRIGQLQLPGIHQIVAGEAAQPGIAFARKVQVGLRERAPIRLVGVAIAHPKIVFEDEIKRSPAGLGYVQANDHSRSIARLRTKAFPAKCRFSRGDAHEKSHKFCRVTIGENNGERL